MGTDYKHRLNQERLLYDAIKNGDLESITTIIKSGPKFFTSSSIGPNKETFLFIATKYNQIEAVKLLLELGCVIFDGCDFHKYPLYLAVERGYDDIIKVFLEHKYVYIDIWFSDG